MATSLSLCEATISLTINNFSSFEKSVLSPPCYIHGMPWKILVMPRSQDDKKALGFFVQCNAESESKTWSCEAVAELRLKSFKSDKYTITRKIKHKFCSGENDFGFSYFVSWTELTDPENMFIQNDSMKVEVLIVANFPNGEI